MRSVIRIGILGAARIASSAVIAPAEGSRRVRVTAIAARDPKRAVAFAADHGLPTVHSSYAHLVEDPTIDAVYNPLPNGLHGAWTARAIRAGKHVLCEKPFAANADEARRVADVAASSDRVVMEAFHWRYHPLADRLLDLVHNGDLGDIRHVEATFCAPIRNRQDIRWNLDLAGGSTMDMGCYAIHFVRTMTGEEPAVTEAAAKERLPGVDRWLRADLSFPSGTTGRVTCGMWTGRGLDVRARIVGTRGAVGVLNFVAPQTASLLRIRIGRRLRFEIPDRRATYDFQLEAFAGAVGDGRPVPTGPDDAVANMRVIDAAYEAAGLPVRQPTPVGD